MTTTWGLYEWGTVAWGDTAQPDDYVPILVQLLPQGKAWNLDPDGMIVGLLTGLAYEPSRVEQRVADLFDEMDPRTAYELLEDWERVLGLPEDCGTPPETLEARRLAAHAKLTAKPAANAASSSVPSLTKLANDLGYPDVFIERLFDPFTAVSACTAGLWVDEGYWSNAFLLRPGGTTENDGTLRCLVNKKRKSRDIALFETPDWWPVEVVGRDFDGASDRLRWVAPAGAPGGTDPYTFAAWIFVRAFGGAQQSIASFAKAGGLGGQSIDFYMLGTGTVELFHDAVTTDLRQRSSELVPAGVWTHVAVTVDGSGAAAGTKIYLNGVETSAYSFSQDGVGELEDLQGEWTLGLTTWGSFPCGGTQTQSRFWAGVLTPTEVWAEYQSIHRPVKTDGLLWAPRMSDLVDPISGLTGVATGTTVETVSILQPPDSP